MRRPVCVARDMTRRGKTNLDRGLDCMTAAARLHVLRVNLRRTGSERKLLLGQDLVQLDDLVSGAHMGAELLHTQYSEAHHGAAVFGNGEPAAVTRSSYVIRGRLGPTHVRRGGKKPSRLCHDRNKATPSVAMVSAVDRDETICRCDLPRKVPIQRITFWLL